MCQSLSDERHAAEPLQAGGAKQWLARTWRGVLLVIGITLAAYVLRSASYLSAISPLIIAVILGAIWRNTIGTHPWAHDE